MQIDDITSKDVYDAAVAGDQLAKDIFNFTGEILGQALADFTAFSAPEAFVIFGGLAKSGEMLMKPLRNSFENHVMNLWKGKVKILVSELKEADAAVLGASALGWEARILPTPAAAAPRGTCCSPPRRPDPLHTRHINYAAPCPGLRDTALRGLLSRLNPGAKPHAVSCSRPARGRR